MPANIFDEGISDMESPRGDLHMEDFVCEAVYGMRGSTQSPAKHQTFLSRGRKNAKWHRLKEMFHWESARELGNSIALVAIGVLFSGTVPTNVLEQIRENIATNWFILTRTITESCCNNQDWMVDSVLPVFSQALYRLVANHIPADFPTSRALWLNHTDEFLLRLASIVGVELFGFPLARRTCVELRRRYFNKQLLDHPHLSTEDSRKAEMRNQQIAAKVGLTNPLNFGTLNQISNVDEEQLHVVVETRAALKNASPGFGTGLEMPPLVPAELSFDRYEEMVVEGELLFERYTNFRDTRRSTIMSQFPLGDDPMDELPSSGHSPSNRKKGARTHHRWHAERRCKDNCLAEKMVASLPNNYSPKNLSTAGISPLVSRLAPGIRAMQNSGAVHLSMRHSTKDRTADLSVAENPGKDASRTTSTLPPVADGTLQGRRNSVMRQLRLERMEVVKNSYDQHKKEYDIVTGQKRVRMDGDRLKREEDATLQKHYALIGSRSEPALKPEFLAASRSFSRK